MMTASLCMLAVGNPSIILDEMISATTSVISLCVELCAVYTIWLGFLELVEKSGLGEKLAKLLRPVIRKLIKTDDEETERLIAMNMSANILGLGNASTPLGLKAMKKLDNGSSVASPMIIMLLILNTTSLQLLPTTIIGLRQSAGSVSAPDIILPTLLASIITTFVAISLALVCQKIRAKRSKK